MHEQFDAAKLKIESNRAYIEINSSEAKQIIDAYDTVGIAISAPWCAHCYYSFTNGDYIDVLKNRKMFFIMSNYDINGMEKILSKSPVHNIDTIYIMDYKEFGDNEGNKIKGFTKAITNLPDSMIFGGVPQHFLYGNGKLLKNGVSIDNIK